MRSPRPRNGDDEVVLCRAWRPGRSTEANEPRRSTEAIGFVWYTKVKGFVWSTEAPGTEEKH